MNKYVILTALALSSAVISASAQNLNPTVEVTNAYSSKMLEAHKPQQIMTVPDSLLKFDLDFDYSVLSNPYKGGYDFSPYFLKMKPDPDAYKGKKLCFRAGAGYSLHPMLDAVWSPVFKRKAFQMNVYANGNGFFGNYKNTVFKSVDGTYLMSPVLKDDIEGRDMAFKGHDASLNAGFNARYDWDKSFLTMSIAYSGIFSGDYSVDMRYNSASLALGFHGKEDRFERFVYGAELGYNFMMDGVNPSAEYFSGIARNLSGGEFFLKGYFGPVWDSDSSLRVDVGMEMDAYSNLYKSQSGHLFLAPKYIASIGKANISLGVKLDAPISSGTVFENFALNTSKGQYIYPDVKLDYRLIEDYLDVYAQISGGVDINSYSNLKKRNHFFSPLSFTDCAPLVDNEIQRINTSLGFRGNLSSVFRFDLSAGYLSASGSLVDYLKLNSTVYGQHPFVSVIGQSENKLFASLKYALRLDSFDLDGSVRYENSNLLKKESGLGFVSSPLSGNLNARYNWNKRIYAGIHTDASVARLGRLSHIEQLIDVELPGFVNLGLDAEFALTKKISLWLSADNLLNQTIIRSAYYAESGVNITAGICVNL